MSVLLFLSYLDEALLLKPDLYEAVYFGFKEYFSITLGWFQGFKLLITGNFEKKDIAGPIGIAKVSGSVIEKGLVQVLIKPPV